MTNMSKTYTIGISLAALGLLIGCGTTKKNIMDSNGQVIIGSTDGSQQTLEQVTIGSMDDLPGQTHDEEIIDEDLPGQKTREYRERTQISPREIKQRYEKETSDLPGIDKTIQGDYNTLDDILKNKDPIEIEKGILYLIDKRYGYLLTEDLTKKPKSSFDGVGKQLNIYSHIAQKHLDYDAQVRIVNRCLQLYHCVMDECNRRRDAGIIEEKEYKDIRKGVDDFKVIVDSYKK